MTALNDGEREATATVSFAIVAGLSPVTSVFKSMTWLLFEATTAEEASTLVVVALGAGSIGVLIFGSSVGSFRFGGRIGG